MTKRTARALALVFSATPLLLIGCGDSENKGGTGGSISGTGGAKYDGGGAGGTKLDVGAEPEVTPPAVDATTGSLDVAVAPDTTPVVVLDAGIPDAPIGPDVTIAFDTATIDSHIAIDTATPVDTTPVVVCTMTTPFTGGYITANLTLTKACSPYHITEGIRVDGNAILTIEPGVTLAFESGLGIGIGYDDSTSGKLVAVGTAQSLITFTSAAASPAAGDWSGIYFWGGTMGGTKIAYANLDYCGSDSACIEGSNVKTGRVVLDHMNIDHVGATADGILENDDASNFTISNSTFSNIKSSPAQKYAISVSAPSFAGIGSTNTFNGGAMIELAGGKVTSTTSWVNPGTDIAVTSNLGVDDTSGPVLTLGPGMKLKFAAGTSFDIRYSNPGHGSVIIAGAEPDGGASGRVVLTSLLSSPAAGDWVGLYVWSGGKAQISYADISYAGSYSSTPGDLVVEDGNSTSVISVDHSSFTHSMGYGVYVKCADMASTPLTKVTLDASNTYSNNANDTANAGTEATNVGPGLNLNCP